MIAMATPIVKASERSSAGRIFASRFTKRQVRYRGGYKVLSTSGNCWSFFVSLLCREGSWERLELPLHAGSLFPPRSALLLPSATQGDHRLSHVPRLPTYTPALGSAPGGGLHTRPLAFRTAACRATARRRLSPPGIPRGSPPDHDS